MATIVFSESETLGAELVPEELGGFSLRKVSRSVKSTAKTVQRTPAVKAIAKGGKTVVTSPYVRAGAAGLAVAFPPAAPAAAAIETANYVLRAAEEGQKQGRAIIDATKRAAASGDVAAKRGLAVLEQQSKAREKMRANRANPTAGVVRPSPKAAQKPAVATVLQQAKHALTPGTGKPPAGSVKVRGLWVTREGLVFRE